jgi:nucleotide-binding universal stress UspA family protein
MKTESSSAVGAPTAITQHPAPNDEPLGFMPQAITLKNILVPLDFSEMALKSLDYAVPFARQYDAKITLLHVVELKAYSPVLPDPEPLGPEHHTEVLNQLEKIRDEYIPADVAADVTVRHNFIFDGILEAARETEADLIITTTHGHTGLQHMLLGSTAESIVRKAPCPVLVVR